MDESRSGDGPSFGVVGLVVGAIILTAVVVVTFQLTQKSDGSHSTSAEMATQLSESVGLATVKSELCWASDYDTVTHVGRLSDVGLSALSAVDGETVTARKIDSPGCMSASLGSGDRFDFKVIGEGRGLVECSVRYDGKVVASDTTSGLGSTARCEGRIVR